MLISTGKSGGDRYYACGGGIRQGKGTCAGRRVRMEETDDLVMNAVMEEMLTTPRMRELLEALHQRKIARDNTSADSRADHQKRLNDAETRLRRLIQAIENAAIDPSDPTLKVRIDGIRAERGLARRAVANALSELTPEAKLTNAIISEPIDPMRQNLATGDMQSRRAYLRALSSTPSRSAMQTSGSEEEANGLSMLCFNRTAWLRQCPVLFASGGSSGIRTLEPLRVAGFQDRCNRPLCQASTFFLQQPSGSVHQTALPRPRGRGIILRQRWDQAVECLAAARRPEFGTAIRMPKHTVHSIAGPTSHSPSR